MVERAFADAPYPELAAAYLDMRPGDSNADRFARAKTLAKLAAGKSGEQDRFSAGRARRPRFRSGARSDGAARRRRSETDRARMCLLMAEIEEEENGESGPRSPMAGAWLARAARPGVDCRRNRVGALGPGLP